MFISKILEEQKRRIQRERNKETAKNIVAGITIGSALGILLAPKSGEETRADIKDKSIEVGEDIKNNIDKKKEGFDDFKNTLSQIKLDIKERAAKGVGPIDDEVQDKYINFTEIEVYEEDIDS